MFIGSVSLQLEEQTEAEQLGLAEFRLEVGAFPCFYELKKIQLMATLGKNRASNLATSEIIWPQNVSP
jgi:hypothetical protein